MQLGDVQCNTRVAMAAMTRARADPVSGAPTAVVADYYAQRSAGGAILVSEAIAVSQRGALWQ